MFKHDKVEYATEITGRQSNQLLISVQEKDNSKDSGKGRLDKKRVTHPWLMKMVQQKKMLWLMSFLMLLKTLLATSGMYPMYQ